MIKYLATLLLVMLPYGVQAHDTTRADGTGICHQHSGGPATSPDDVRRMIDSALDVRMDVLARVMTGNARLVCLPRPDSVMVVDTSWCIQPSRDPIWKRREVRLHSIDTTYVEVPDAK